MFEQEIELEKGKGGWGPMLLVVVLIGCIVGGIGYYVYQMKKGLSPQEASADSYRHFNRQNGKDSFPHRRCHAQHR